MTAPWQRHDNEQQKTASSDTKKSESGMLLDDSIARPVEPINEFSSIKLINYESSSSTPKNIRDTVENS